jgi:hypothetical protein
MPGTEGQCTCAEGGSRTRYGPCVVDEPDTEELEAEQLQRMREERKLAQEAPEPDEEAQHERRAEKAAYLLKKLEDQAESERGERAGGG